MEMRAGAGVGRGRGRGKHTLQTFLGQAGQNSVT